MIKSTDFRLPGGRSGVLLIHGLTGTPTEMRFVAKGLNRNGFTVHGMQLAGHCGDEEDLLKTGWRDWYRSVCEAADRLRGEVDHMFVAGLSMGALLALKLAADRPDQVDGLGLYGTHVLLRRLDDSVDRPTVVHAAAGLQSRPRPQPALPRMLSVRHQGRAHPPAHRQQHAQRRQRRRRPARQSVAVAGRVLPPVVPRAPTAAQHPARHAWSCTRSTTTSPA